MKLWTIFFVACLAAASGHCDELTQAKGDDIRLLMKEIGAANLGAQMITAMVPAIKRSLTARYPEIPPKTLEKIGERLGTLMTTKMSTSGGIVDQVVPIYAAHFTHNEIKQLLAFYRTDVGQKVVKELPLVMTESMAVGQKWGNSMAPEIQSLVEQAFTEDRVVLNKK